MMASTSSLQQRVQQQQQAPQQQQHQAQQQQQSNNKGSGFESCFAGGLDLSEFGESFNKNKNNKKKNNKNNSSASAQLLQVVQKRAAEKEYNEVQEVRLHETIQKRALQLQEERRTTQELRLKTTPPSESLMGSLTATLISMHGHDEHGGGCVGINKKTNKKDAASRQLGKRMKQQQRRRVTTPKATTKVNSNSKVTKKANRAKYH